LFRAFPVDGINTDIPHTRQGNLDLLEKLKRDHAAPGANGFKAGGDGKPE